jgi:hypothetical protein
MNANERVCKFHDCNYRFLSIFYFCFQRLLRGVCLHEQQGEPDEFVKKIAQNRPKSPKIAQNLSKSFKIAQNMAT